MTRLIVMLYLMFVSIPSYSAVVLSINPAQQTTQLNSVVAIDINISGLDGNNIALSGFDINIEYDSSLLQVSQVTFGNQLNLLGSGDIQDVIVEPNRLNIFELSLDSESALLSGQSPAFNLATILFQTLNTGYSPIVLTINSIADAAGNPLSVSLASGNLTITSVPLPATSYLMVFGLMALFRKRRIRLNTLS